MVQSVRLPSPEDSSQPVWDTSMRREEGGSTVLKLNANFIFLHDSGTGGNTRFDYGCKKKCYSVIVQVFKVTYHTDGCERHQPVPVLDDPGA